MTWQWIVIVVAVVGGALTGIVRGLYQSLARRQAEKDRTGLPGLPDDMEYLTLTVPVRRPADAIERRALEIRASEAVVTAMSQR